MRINRYAPVTLTVTFEDDETPVTAGTVTVNVVDANGTSLTSGAGVAGDVGVYTFDLTAAQTANLGLYVVTWTGSNGRQATTRLEIASGVPFSLSELRSSSSTISDTSKYPTSALRAVRDAVEDEFLSITGVAFSPRYGRYTEDVTGLTAIEVPHFRLTEIISVTDAGTDTAVDLSEVTFDDFGRIEYPSGFAGRVTVEYVHGYATPPEDVLRAFLAYAVYRLHTDRGSGTPERAETFQTAEGGTFRLAVAGRAGYRTGLPEVDAVLDRYSFKVGVY